MFFLFIALLNAVIYFAITGALWWSAKHVRREWVAAILDVVGCFTAIIACASVVIGLVG